LIGAAGAVVATLLWGAVLRSTATLLMEPTGIARLLLFIAIPVAMLASFVLVMSVADVAVLVRRADVGLPSRVAWLHLAMAIVLVWAGEGRGWMTALGIAATQLIAIWLFQMTPPHASSQR
jgi:hypothetical protein